MLIVARHEGEEILIADGLIRIKVVNIQGKIARIGIDAPREIRVVRKEVADRDAGGDHAGKDRS